MIIDHTLTNLNLCRLYVEKNNLRDELLFCEGTVGRLYYVNPHGNVYRGNYVKYRSFKNLFTDNVVIPLYLEKGYNSFSERDLYDKYLLEISGMTVEEYRKYVKKMRKNNLIREEKEERVFASKEERKEVILRLLKENPLMDSNELADQLGVTRQRVSMIIQEMDIDFGKENRKQIETQMIEDIIKITQDADEILRIVSEKELNERLARQIIKDRNLNKPRIFETKIPNVQELIKNMIDKDNTITINRMAEVLKLSPMTISRQLRSMNLTKVDDAWVQRADDHLPIPKADPEVIISKIKEILEKDSTLTIRKMSKIIGVSERTISKHMGRMNYVWVKNQWVLNDGSHEKRNPKATKVVYNGKEVSIAYVSNETGLPYMTIYNAVLHRGEDVNQVVKDALLRRGEIT